MLEWLEVEEQVGRAWHRLVGGAGSYEHHAEAAVALRDVQAALSIFFHALGGTPTVQVGAVGQRNSAHRLNWRQRLGMDEERLPQSRLDEASLLLPDSIAVFADKALNRQLYFWLAAFFSQAAVLGPVAEAEPLARDIAFLRKARQGTQAALDAFPGLRPMHAALCAALRLQRKPRSLPPVEAAVEEVVAFLLGGPAPSPSSAVWRAVSGEGAVPPTPRGYRPFLPVPLWGDVVCRPLDAADDSDDDGAEAAGGEEESEKKLLAIRKSQDQAEREDPLILNRFEKILALAEMVNVNRAVDDDEEEEARKAAEDLDHLTLAKNQRKAATKLKLDLDVAGRAVPTAPVTATHRYPEWDYRLRGYHRDHCAVLSGLAPEEGEDWRPDAEAARRIRRVQRQFEALRPRNVLLTRQADGDDLDLEAVVRSHCDQMATGIGSERLYTQFRRQARDLSVALLVDVSLSTDSWVENRRVLDVEKEAVTTLAKGIDACGDEQAIFTFSSKKRSRVTVSTVKDFDERLSDGVLRRIGALKPGQYTRMGAAIRHVTKQLAERPHHHRLLLVLTDGKPNDQDHYEGRYGVEDARKAVQEARRQGLAVFGVTIDRKAQDYFPAIFGRGSFAIIDHVDRLSSALPKIYRQLVS